MHGEEQEFKQRPQPFLYVMCPSLLEKEAECPQDSLVYQGKSALEQCLHLLIA